MTCFASRPIQIVSWHVQIPIPQFYIQRESTSLPLSLLNDPIEFGIYIFTITRKSLLNRQIFNKEFSFPSNDDMMNDDDNRI